MKNTLIWIIAIVIVGGGIYAFTKSDGEKNDDAATKEQPAAVTQTPANTTSSSTSSTGSAAKPTPTTNVNVKTTTSSGNSGSIEVKQFDPVTKKFTVNASDEKTDLSTITVNHGDFVTITFNVSKEGTYYGGLDFRSSVINTGTINAGASKTISFTADKSFTFVPYWPASNIKKSYTIDVVVK